MVPGLGDQALLMKIVQVNGPLPDGTYYPGDYLLVARVGDYLADVDAPAFPGGSPGKAVRSVMTALAGRLSGWAEPGCGATQTAAAGAPCAAGWPHVTHRGTASRRESFIPSCEATKPSRS